MKALTRHLVRLDAALSAWPRRRQYLTIALLIASLAGICLTDVPRRYLDYAHIPILKSLSQPEEYGTDTIADAYEAKVVLHDWKDMYVKAGVDQNALEARTWSKDASAPYPPMALLIEAGLYWIGEKAGVGFYGMILVLAIVLVAQIVVYCLRTRWYLFPLLCVSGVYFGYRFTYVQDATYLIMLVIVMTALLLAMRRSPWAHLWMALGITIKLSPLYYIENLRSMDRRTALMFIAILCVGLVIPIFALKHYLYIYGYHATLKATPLRTVGAIAVCVPLGVLLSYVEKRCAFDMEDRIGWGLVPLALFFAIQMNVARHLLVVLLVPDKRGVRTLASAVGVGATYLSFGLLRFNSALPISTAVLLVGLAYHAKSRAPSIARDTAHDTRAARAMLTPTTASRPEQATAPTST